MAGSVPTVTPSAQLLPSARFFPVQIRTISRRFWEKKNETVPTVKPSAQGGTLTAAA
jgi:hypothetical protein